jgi:hypothetical protein
MDDLYIGRHEASRIFARPMSACSVLRLDLVFLLAYTEDWLATVLAFQVGPSIPTSNRHDPYRELGIILRVALHLIYTGMLQNSHERN